MVVILRRGFMLTPMVVSELVILIFLHVLLQFPLPYQLLYLLFQIPTIFYVVAMIFVKSAKLVLIADVRG